MLTPMRALLSVIIILSAAGCGGGLDLQLVEAAHNRPSNVAVYFTVDTSAGEPLPGLTAADFNIYEDGALVSVDESQQTIINPEVAAEHYTLLLVDMSGSVTESDQVPLIVEAATQFTSTVESHQKVAVYAFDGEEDIHRITDFTGGGSAAAGVSRLGSFRSQDPSTNLHGALVQGTTELTEAFLIGFLVFIPFLIVDMVVSNVLLALGMHMLSPTTVALPFKLLLFVLVDGWYLLARALVLGYV